MIGNGNISHSRGLNAELLPYVRPAGYAARRAYRDACAARGPPSPLLTLVWSTATTTAPPRGPIYFPESLPLSPLSLLSRRRSYAPHTPGRPSCRVHHAVAGSIRDSVSSRVSFACRNPFKIILSPRSTKWCGFSAGASPPREGENCCGCVHFRIEIGGVQPLSRGSARVFIHGTCVPRGPKRRIHLLPLLPSGIRRAGTTVSVT